MAVRIRLMRMGRKKKPFYRIVVIDSKARRDGAYIERVGYYDPLTNPATVKIEREKVLSWLEKGAIPSETVFNLLQKEGIALEWHLVKNKVDSKAANIELQKWSLLKKVPVTKIEAATEMAENVEEVEEPVEPKSEETDNVAASESEESSEN